MTQRTDLSGIKVLLEGPSGTGKTYAIGPLVEWAVANQKEVFVLFTENGLETLLGYWTDKGKPIPDNLHWRTLNTKPLGLKSLIDAADKVGKMTYESLTKLQDATRSQNNAFHTILMTCADFPDDRTGQTFGSVDSWDNNRIFVIDSLSELANASMKMVIGNKPTAAPPDYGIAQNNLMNFLRLLTTGCQCHFILTAHVDRIKDDITGGIRLMTKAIGQAISGDIPPLFSDVIFTVREGTDFSWDTASMNVDVKTRSLPIAAKQRPDFSVIMNKWQARANSSVAGTDASK
jgi:archaellum biogenesis ATPase FlaH